MDKVGQEKKLLQDQITSLKENIATEMKERQELEARLRTLEDSSTRPNELEELYQRVYTPKLQQFEKMMAKMSALKVKLEAAK